MMMGYILQAMIIIISIDVLLFFGQLAAIDTDPSANLFYDFSGSIIAPYNNGSGGNYSFGPRDVLTDLPDVQGAQSTSGLSSVVNIFLDPISSIVKWFLNLPGINIIYGAITSMPRFLKSIDAPAAFVFGVSGLWYATHIIMLIAFVVGRDA